MAKPDLWPEIGMRRVGRTKSPIVRLLNVRDDVLLVWREDGSIYAASSIDMKPGTFVRVRKAAKP